MNTKEAPFRGHIPLSAWRSAPSLSSRFASLQNHGHQAPDVANGDTPIVGEAMGEQTGVDAPSPRQDTGVFARGGAAGASVANTCWSSSSVQ